MCLSERCGDGFYEVGAFEGFVKGTVGVFFLRQFRGVTCPYRDSRTSKILRQGIMNQLNDNAARRVSKPATKMPKSKIRRLV